VGELHRSIMLAFGPAAGDARAVHGVLWRLDLGADGGIVLLVQSRSRPAWGTSQGPNPLAGIQQSDDVAVKTIDGAWSALVVGDELVFRLRANATKRITREAEGEQRRTTRVPVRGEVERLRWLQRKGAQHGFELVAVRGRPEVVDAQVIEEPDAAGWRGARGGHQRLTFASARFDGRLRITDAEAFRSALAQGVGPAKAYGFGLLSIARPYADQ
jgi:CRISPR system Cascade subunit CasE